jgi:hypothetical protein
VPTRKPGFVSRLFGLCDADSYRQPAAPHVTLIRQFGKIVSFCAAVVGTSAVRGVASLVLQPRLETWNPRSRGGRSGGRCRADLGMWTAAAE